MAEIIKKAAAAYIGANSVQMLIGRIQPDSFVFTENEYVAFSRISETFQSTHRLSENGMSIVLNALNEMHSICRESDVHEIRIAASSSLRFAENRNIFLLNCRKEFGVYPQILSGNDESRLNFLGAAQSVPPNIPLITVYIGYNNLHAAYGTSTEIAGLLELPIGIGMLNRKFDLDRRTVGYFGLFSLMRELKKYLNAPGTKIKDWYKQFSMPPTLLFTGPFPSLYLSLKKGEPLLSNQDLGAVPQMLDEVRATLKKVAQMSPAQRASLPGVSPNLGNTLFSGIAMICALLETSGLHEFRVSSYGLCTGLLKVPIELTSYTTNLS